VGEYISQTQAMTFYHLTAKSSNAKTGPIAVTTSSADTCPTTCPFNNGGGCYAASGPLKLHWDKVTSGERGGSWLDLQDAIGKAKLAPGSLLRHNQAGDLPHENGAINWPIVGYLKTIFQAAQLRAFTYTHHAQTEYNLMVVSDCNAAGFTVNLSCDSEIQAARRHLDGFPSVCVVPADDARRSWSVAGVKVQTCPAQLKDGITCATCQLCTKADRSCVVAFRAHGSSARKVSQRVGVEAFA
jgi:hypothetical protein